MKRVFDSLAKLVGSRDKKELQVMKSNIEALPVPEDERIGIIEAIDTLIEFLP